MKVKGIHHISAISGHAQENVDFYSGVLSLKMAIKTVNFDQYNIYHLYYTNQNYELGSALTYFPWKKSYKEGIVGRGQVVSSILSIPKGSKKFWMQRLNQFRIPFDIIKRFNEERVSFKDRHGLSLELVETNLEKSSEFEFNGVTKDAQIQGIYGALLQSHDYKATYEFFTEVLGLDYEQEDGLNIRLSLDSEIGKYIELSKLSIGEGKDGKGTYHHIAFIVDEDLEIWRDYLLNHGLEVTEVKDRNFFKSIYMKEPGGIMVELASRGEKLTPQSLNPELYIPEKFKKYENSIHQALYPVFVNEITYLNDYPYENLEEYKIYEAHQNLLSEINRLAKKSREEGLTQEETIYRDKLRRQYIENITKTIAANLENVQVEDQNNNFVKLERKKKDNS